MDAQLRTADLVERMTGFSTLLRERGVAVPPAAAAEAIAALACADPADPLSGQAALRCTLVSRREDLAVFGRAFAEFWLGISSLPAEEAEEGEAADAVDGVSPADSGAGGEEANERDLGVAGSDAERLKHLDFATYGPEEMRAAQELMGRIARTLPRRLTRRLQHDRRGGQLDVRRTLIDSMHTGGVPIRRAWRGPRTRRAGLVLVLDVSGSMQPYARALLGFALAAVRADRQVEAFTFGTRLTRVTEMLAERRPQIAIEAVSAAVPDWTGGTRIGENIQTLNERWASRGYTRGAIVVILSDGWECGDPELLAAELARLRRSARAVIWANPLAGRPGYEPLTAGMVAALPELDRLLPAGDLSSLSRLSELIGAYATSRSSADA
jgi:uncharacterized protein with von Willebrand factor type A (vWA) domain